MVGICGILFRDSLVEDCVSSMLSKLKGRGGDQLDHWHDKQISLGVSGGNVWHSPDGTIHILFDGLITNFEEIIQKIPEIPSDPHEAICFLYQKENDQFIQHLEGEFAIAIYNTSIQELLILRDRWGKKPLYWTYSRGHFIFSSELKGIIATNLFTLSPDLEAISQYFSFGYLPLENTPIQNVYKLFPGHFLRFTRDREYFIRPYFRLTSALKKKSETWSYDEYHYLLQKAIKATHQDTSPPLFYSFKEMNPLFQGAEQKVLPYEFSEKDLESLEQMVWEADEPIGDPLAFYSWVQFHKLKNGKEVALSTASISWFSEHISCPKLPEIKYKEKTQSFLRKTLEVPFLRKHLSPQLFRKLNLHPLYRTFLLNQYLPPHELQHQMDLVDPAIFLHHFPAIDRLNPSLNSLLYLFIKTALPHKYLSYQEKILSRLGMHLCTPFLEDKVFRYILSVPEHAIASQSQLTLISLFNDTPPIDPIPFGKILKSPAFTERINRFKNGFCIESGLISEKTFQTIQKNAHKRPYFNLLWSLLIMETWQKTFFDHP